MTSKDTDKLAIRLVILIAFLLVVCKVVDLIT